MNPVDDTFTSIADEHRVAIKVLKSEFIAVTFAMSEASQLEARRHLLIKELFDASHHCWAWRLRIGRIEHSSDAGEPSGTAGRPILSAIQSAGLWDCGVLVARYFGGIKLGTGGLARAYRGAAKEVLQTAPRVVHFEYQRVTVRFTFSQTSTVYRLISPPHIVLAEESFEEGNELQLDVRRSLVDQLKKQLDEKRVSYSVAEL